ncbi:MAG: guanylate kinase [Spartobacteria bacterium]|nr:guanylate kinase [Spartobacteria bacterium]
MIEREHIPLLLVISAPSGAGKTTLCHSLVGEFDEIIYSVSCTTRAPRPSEVDGKSYHFLGKENFLMRVDRGEFIEFAQVYEHMYGTLRQTILDGFARGKHVLMDLDVQGAAQIREKVRQAPADDPLRRGYLDIFIVPPSMQVLEERLRGRGQDADDVINLRLSRAQAEISRWHEYQYCVVNDNLERSYGALRSIYIAELQRVRP